MQRQILQKLNDLIANDRTVDQRQFPDFSHDYRWRILSMKSDEENKLYLIYDPELSRVYFIQDIY